MGNWIFLFENKQSYSIIIKLKGSAFNWGTKIKVNSSK
jgi:hypothetical protein